MDHGWTNDQTPLAIHTLDAIGAEKAHEKLPEGYNPWSKHYEETEIEAMRHYNITGGQLVHQIPPAFGVLCHPNPTNGKYYCRFTKGDDHGMARAEDDGEYEAAKFNQRLNPRPDRVGNYKIDRSDAIRTEDDMKAGNLALFPDVGGLVTSAPFKASGIPFAQNEAKQTSAFFTGLWNIAELRQMLIERLFPYCETLSNFTRTCQEIRMGVEGELGYFATNRLDFLKCDKSPAELKDLVASGELTQEAANSVRVPKFLVVCPVRYKMTMAPGFHGNPKSFWPPQVWHEDEEPQSPESLFNEYGFRVIAGYTQKRKDISCVRNCVALQKALKAFYTRWRNFHYVALVYFDMMNIQTIEAIIDSLQNLRCLNVWSCPLIDLSQIRALVRIVGKVNDARRKAKKLLLDLDIAPRFRQGPIGHRMGSYGITHSDPRLYNNWNTDIGHALAANIVSLLREADKAGIELCQPGKAFRLWLDKLPLNINQAYNLCVTAANYLDNEKTAVNHAYEVYPSPVDDEPRSDLIKRFHDTVSIDLVAAATARPVDMADFQRQGKFLCTTCGETLPGKLFRNESQVRDARWVTCEGCELNFQLEYERGDSHIQMTQLANFIWRDAPTITLDWVLGESDDATRNWRNLFARAKNLPTKEDLLLQAEHLDCERQDLVDEMSPMCAWRDKKPIHEQIQTIDKMIELLRIRAGFQRQPKPCLATTYDWDYRRRAYNWRGQVERGEVDSSKNPYENLAILTLEKHFTMLH